MIDVNYFCRLTIIISAGRLNGCDGDRIAAM
jgi:hypothetical protein